MKQIKIIVLLLCFLPLLANKCDKKKDEVDDSSTTEKVVAEDMMKEIYGKTWMNSFEEDKDGAKAYRVSTYEFPPARGRSGFEIAEDGAFYEVAPGPTDALEKTEGKWRAQEDKILVQVDEKEYMLELVSYEDGLLMLKKTEM